MSYLSQLPVEICETLSYYIEPLYIFEILKLDCFASLVSNDKFWKNRLKHNFPDIFIDTLSTKLYKELCIKMSIEELHTLELTITNPLVYEMDKVEKNLYHDLVVHKSQLVDLSKEVDYAHKLYMKALDKFRRAEKSYNEKTVPIINTVQSATRKLYEFLDVSARNNGDFYSIAVDEGFMQQLKFNYLYMNTTDNLRQIKELADLVSISYGSQKLIKHYKTGQMVDKIIVDHGVGIGIQWSHSVLETPDIIFWIDFKECVLRKTIGPYLPYFLEGTLNEKFTLEDYQRLYNVPFTFASLHYHGSKSLSSSSNTNSSEEDQEATFLTKRKPYWESTS